MTNKAPSSPKDSATIWACPCAISWRAASRHEASSNKGKPVSWRNSRKLGLTRYTPAAKVSAKAAPFESNTNQPPTSRTRCAKRA